MALTTCADCGRGVSNAAVSCPNCGRPLAADAAAPAPAPAQSNWVPASLGCLTLLLLLGMCATMQSGEERKRRARQPIQPATGPAVVAAPGPGWIRGLDGRQVWFHPDSISRIGRGVYRVVIFRRMGEGWHQLSTDEVQCARMETRTVRSRDFGRVTSDRRTPDAEWGSTGAATPAAILFARICDVAIQRAFGSGGR